MAINNPVITDSDWLQATAVAIQNKDGGSKMEVPDFARRVDALPAAPVLIPKTITENGVYNASSDNVDGYDVVTVDVPERNTLDEYFADTLVVANIPSATSIQGYLFQSKRKLANVIMPNVISIGDGAFQGCINLALTSLPNGVTAIDNYAFGWCTSIPYLDFSNFTQIPTLGAHAFDNTTFPLYFRDQQQIDEWAAATNWSTYAARLHIKPSEVI